MSGRRPVRRRSAGAVLAALASLAAPLLVSARAGADATTGLWPELKVPPQDGHATAGPSKDAALVVGIDRYDALPRVVGAADNARDWEKYFLFGRKVPPERVALLTDQNGTVEAITQRATELAAKVPEGGTLFVVFIGHGAPAQGGQKGLLLGADVRPSDASFAARSVSYDQLETTVSSGSQARTVMILDACFSGIDAAGKTLLPSVQPVVATSIIANPKTTILSAGTAAEYAGALPGSQRPALSYLVLGALRGWGDADNDGSVTAAEAHEYASLVLRSLPNNHAQHPQIVSDASTEPLETETKEKAPDLAVIRSKLDTWTPPVDKKPEPKLRVAVGCGDSAPRGPDDGLDVFLDRSPAAQLPSGGENAWDAEAKRNAVRHIEFPITTGEHHVVIRVPGCTPAELDVVADESGADVRGVLRSSASLMLRGPAGDPDWGRAAVGLWMPRSVIGSYVKGLDHVPGTSAYGGLNYGVGATGFSAQAALAFRWWTMGVDFAYGSGPARREQDPVVTTPAILAAVDQAHVTWLRAGLRAGARFPFNVAALSVGPMIGYDNVFLDNLPVGLSGEDQRHNMYLGGWATLDAHVFCDWPFFASFDMEDRILSPHDAVGLMSLTFGVAFQPNRVCKIERSTKYELTQGRKEALR